MLESAGFYCLQEASGGQVRLRLAGFSEGLQSPEGKAGQGSGLAMAVSPLS